MRLLTATILLLIAAPASGDDTLPPPAGSQTSPVRYRLSESTFQPASDAQDGVTRQPPVESTDEPEVDPEQPLPDTNVIGRPDRLNPFPGNPLTAETAVTPVGTASDASSFGGSLTVISGEQIRRSGQVIVADVLRGGLGLDVARSGGLGGATSVFIRGGNSNQTKVLLDGIPINDPSNPAGAFDFSTLAVDNIERIEVLRGPQSMIYGSDAIGGVVNIITRRGSGPAKATSVTEAGNFATARQYLQVQGGNDRGYYSLSGSYLHTDGISRANANLGNSERDRFRMGTVSGRFGWSPSELTNIDYVFRFIDADAEIDDFGVDNLIRANLTTEFFQRVEARSALMEGKLLQRFGFNLTDYARRDTDAGLFGVPSFDGQTRQFDWQGQWLLNCRHTLAAGADYLQQDASSTNDGFVRQHNKGVYVEDRLQLGERWFNTLGFRWDDHSRAGTAQTYRFTSRFEIYETSSSLHGSLGTGFRAPSLAELVFTFGNDQLLPERSKGWDVGLRQQLADGLWVDATYFRNDFRDLIVFDFASFLSQNIGLARASGVELTGGWELDDCTWLTANYTFNDTVDLSFGGPLPRRPRNKASLTINRRLWEDQALLSLYLIYVGPRIDFARRFGGGELAEYFLLNLSGNYQLNERWQLFARIDNALDQDYEEAGGFGVPGVAGYGGVRLVY